MNLNHCSFAIRKDLFSEKFGFEFLDGLDGSFYFGLD